MRRDVRSGQGLVQPLLPYLKDRVLAVGSPLPLVLRPEPLVVPPFSVKLPLLEEATVPNGGAGVAYLSDPLDDVGGLAMNVVSFVLKVVRQSKSIHSGIGMRPNSRYLLRCFTHMSVVSPSKSGRLLARFANGSVAD